MEDLISVKQAAKIAGVTDGRIRQLLIEGEKLKGQKVGFQWVLKRSELERWLKARERA
jgi:excisionase family DNA binding protein